MNLRRVFEQILVIGWMNSLPMLRQPVQLISLVVFAGLPLFYMWALGGMHLISMGLAGAMISVAAFSGMFVSQDIIFNRIWTKFQDIMVASPVRPLAYLLGIAFSNVVSVGFAIIPYSALLVLQGKLNPANAASVLIPIFICYLSNLMLGFFLGTVINDVKTGNSLGNILLLAMVYLPPVYYPITSLPEPLRVVVLIIPTVSAAQIVNNALDMPTAVKEYLPISWSILVLSTIILAFLTMKNIRWREK
ncbi:MAG: ABC transporter permease [Crenarchaeota archaeon]|nr:ABC transporter permease [Thermoproteota archaeon]